MQFYFGQVDEAQNQRDSNSEAASKYILAISWIH